MRSLSVTDLKILHLAVRKGGTFDERHMEDSELKGLGVGRLLDTLASLKDDKMITLNDGGSFSITPVAKEFLWGSSVPVWAKILRLLQIRSCSLEQIADMLAISQDAAYRSVEMLRKGQLILMSAQRYDEKIIRVYEILPEGIAEIDRAEKAGFDGVNPGSRGPESEILGLVDEINREVQESQLGLPQRRAS